MNDPNKFFKDENGEIKYNETCLKCPKSCKQSFRIKVVSCPYLKELKNKKKKGGK